MLLPYKSPTIVRPKNGIWFIKYFYEYPDRPGEFKEFRVKDGINYITDPDLKEKEIQKLLTDVTLALEKENYNPFGQKSNVKKQIASKALDIKKDNDKHKPWTLEESIEHYKAYCIKKNLTENTMKGYKGCMNNFSEYLTNNKKLKLKASEYLENDFQAFIDTYYDQEDWKPRTYNNYISFFKTFFGRVEKLERKLDREIKYFIDLSDIEDKTDKAEKNRAYSGIVAEKVKEELSLPKNKVLNRFIKFIYYSCMRPNELRLLQIQHIDIKNRQIKVTSPTAKTGDRFVPISNELFELINEFNLEKYPFNYYLFNRKGEPAPTPFPKDMFSKIYYPIKVKLQLDKEYTMYAWKHTRVIDLSNAGFKDEEIMKLTGHTDYQAFKAYKRDLMIDTSAMSGDTMSF